MISADFEVTYRSELKFVVQCVTNSVIGDTILVLLMIAALIL